MIDSSRYYVLRIKDPASARCTLLGTHLILHTIHTLLHTRICTYTYTIHVLGTLYPIHTQAHRKHTYKYITIPSTHTAIPNKLPTQFFSPTINQLLYSIPPPYSRACPGVGFRDREVSFDFKNVLNEYVRYVDR